MGRKTVAIIVSLWVISISILVNRIVPDPYMDEIFHIPQAQQYCNGNFFNWDPMITTPPGLYFLSLVHVGCLFPGMFVSRAVSVFSEACSSVILRSTNGVLAVLCSIILYDIIVHLRPNLDDIKVSALSVILALYPLHWFFTFLYYTDVASLTAVLAMYLACLKKKYHFSALFGAIAVFIRQTNIVWMVFVACTGVIDVAITKERKSLKSNELNEPGREAGHEIPGESVAAGTNLRRRKASRTEHARNPSLPMNELSAVSAADSTGFLYEIRVICVASWHLKGELLLSFSSFFSVLVAFVAFVKWNGGVVLGAKDFHAVTPHFAQIMYFSLISALFTAPLHFVFSHVAEMLRAVWKTKALGLCDWLVALTAGFLSVHFFSIAHPYILADNRHYPFYLWRKIIKAHWLMKYLLVPIYVYSWFSILSILAKSRRKLWVLAYFWATAAVLVPAPVIEFRYYTIPFYFFILHSQVGDNKSLILLGLMYLAINTFSMMVFLFRPFHWSHEPGVQRFIW